MGTPAERRALAFLAALVTLGAGVQVAQARKVERAVAAPDHQSALDAQLAAVDSARLRQGHRNRALDPGAREPAARRPRAEPRTRVDRPGPVGVLPPGAPPLPPERVAAGSPVDVDRASAAELEALPRIGPALARRIVEDRAAHGPFGSPEGLTRVKGVGPALVRSLAGRVTFSGGR
jgi:competence protein ComEA